MRALVFALLFVATSAHAQDALPLRDRMLRSELEAAAARDGSRGWLLPVMLAAGSGLVALGAVYPTEFAGVGLPLGTQLLFTGTLTWAGTDDARKLPAQYAAIPDMPQRVRFGEQHLARLAHQSRRNRIAGAVAGIALAASSVPIRYAFARRDEPSYRFGDSYVDYVLITLAAVSATQALLSLFDRTPAELAWTRF